MLKAKALCYRLVKSRKATSCALPSEPSPSTSVAAVSAVSGDHRSRCLSLIVKLGGRGLANSAREVISRVIDGSSSISEAALVVDFAGNNGIELDPCCCGALIRKLTEMGQPGLAETFYNERVIGNEEELLKLLLVLTGGSCEYWYSRRWPRDYGVLCLDHRSYMKHDCPKGNRGDVTVVICPFCATAVRLNPDKVPNLVRAPLWMIREGLVFTREERGEISHEEEASKVKDMPFFVFV